MIDTKEVLIKSLDLYAQEYQLLCKKTEERKSFKNKSKIWKDKSQLEKVKTRTRMEIQTLKKGYINKKFFLYVSVKPFFYLVKPFLSLEDYYNCGRILDIINQDNFKAKKWVENDLPTIILGAQMVKQYSY